ncbi:DUF423 domain-containing protein [Hyphomonas sp.]|jgi:uncharacterized membrane protein YgdD (TMEM256/DUF423 family)|uniref:DUF423 domain-containing protein n=1 Tax=Hyphomonas sp. TaxID=87 RepID=UPI0025BB16FF|nr:DUF423 domain-containing protein [Hyphomonas sp.]
MLARLAALFGFASVALGAFGAHALEGRLTAEGAAWWHTATLYALPHAAAALAAGLSERGGHIARGGALLLIGGVIFSATLYAMALGAPRWLGAVTPLGGVGMLAGWALLALGAGRRT